MKILVTGGSGFLGRHLLRTLKAKGYNDLRVLSHHIHEDLVNDKIEMFCGDLSDPECVSKVVQGCEVVFHTAAKAGVWGPYQDYYQTNVLGTYHILKACKRYGVRQLIYTSTPSVVYNGEDLANVNEKIPYGRRWLCAYAKTKMLAEREVLAQNSESLATVALRPHLIFGPGDNHLIPTLLSLVQKGHVAQVGNGHNWVDISYVENVAEAHYLAMRALERGLAAGHAYFITQGEPVCLWDWIQQLLFRLNWPQIHRKIPYSLAYGLGACLELFYKITRISKQPPMTRFIAKELATHHYFDISASKMDLQYVPKISTEEGTERLIAWLKTQERFS